MSKSVLYVAFTNVDDKTGIPVNEQPCTTTPSLPNVEGLVYDFALESQYPTPIPTMFGTVPEEAGLDWPGFMSVYTADEYEAAKITEMETRVHLAKLRASQRVLNSFNEELATVEGFRNAAETTSSLIMRHLVGNHTAKAKVPPAIQLCADDLGITATEFIDQFKEGQREQDAAIMKLAVKNSRLLDKIERAETAQEASAVHWFMEI